MGIFANRDIKKDEELTFNYNVDRYGYVFASLRLAFAFETHISPVMRHSLVTVARTSASASSVARRRPTWPLWTICILMVRGAYLRSPSVAHRVTPSSRYHGRG